MSSELDQALRDILSRVKAGTLSPEDAADQLDSLGDPAGDDEGGERSLDGQNGRRVGRIDVRSAARPVRIVGDPTVHQAVVTGPHTLAWQGESLVVTSGAEEGGWEEGAFSAQWHRRFGGGPGRWRSEPGTTGDAWPTGSWSHREHVGRGRRGESLIVRMRPDLDLSFTVDAGIVTIEGVVGPIRGRLNAGRATIAGFEGPLDLSVAAGDLRATGRLTHGVSRVECATGRVNVDLLAGSDVRVVRQVTLGTVEFDEEVVGAGRATLEVNVRVGSARIRSRKAASAAAAS